MKKALYETHNIAKELLPFIFHHDRYTKIDSHFSNWHENVEIIHHISGEGYVIIDSERFLLKNNNIIIINSNAMHAFGTDSTVEYDCLIIDKRFFEDIGLDSSQMSFATSIFSDTLAELYSKTALHIDRFRSEPSELDIAKIRAALLALILELCENHREPAENRHTEPSADKIKEVVTYIYQNIDAPLTLDEISKKASMSKYYLCREFKSMTGNTLFEFINTVRCREAKRKILEGSSVSEAALSVGFESLSYFTKKFREIYGKPPSKYKKEAK